MAARAVYRAKPLILIVPCIGSVGCRDEDNVAFVTLNILKVLHEKGFLPSIHLLLVCDGSRIISQSPVEQFLNKLPLFEVERDHAKGFIRFLPHVLQHSLNDDCGLTRITAVLKNAVCDVVM